ncbi:hypothetical protein [Pseudomonas sp. 18175]|uniref:hypothetical protein n=1 Tax=Pseudomonas sp. 18175 TaxID=3390056 RepID=UPI003D1E53B6
MKSFVLFLFCLMVSFRLVAASNQSTAGTLVYSDGVGQEFRSLDYKTRSGRVLKIFDEGLRFSYDSQHDKAISPNKAYSVVHFSEEGVGESDARPDTKYLCAFVRMVDGCVVNVSAGEQCGGEWSTSSLWLSQQSNSGYDFSNDSPTVEGVYRDYMSGRKDQFKVTTPRVLAYLLEGTTFDNILACDPPSNLNIKTYNEMLMSLERDGDSHNFLKLRNALDLAGLWPVKY